MFNPYQIGYLKSSTLTNRNDPELHVVQSVVALDKVMYIRDVSIFQLRYKNNFQPLKRQEKNVSENVVC